MDKSIVKGVSTIALFVLIGAGCSSFKSLTPPVSENTEEPAEQAEPQTTEVSPDTVVIESITVESQTVSNGTVIIKQVSISKDGWLVLHADDKNQPEKVIGKTEVKAGTLGNLVVPVDAQLVTPMLYAMLHVDEGVLGTYEFPGADAPLSVNGQVVLQSFTIQNPPSPQPETPKAASQTNQADSPPTPTVNEKTSANIPVDKPAIVPSVQSFTLSAKQWQFSPSTITVKKGNTVKLTINSIDVTHGFSIPDFNVSETLSPGQTVQVEFLANTSGSFSFFCNVFCGSGHSGMKGTLIVE